jgi:hypothetical protein
MPVIGRVQCWKSPRPPRARQLYFRYPRVLRRFRDGELGAEMDRTAGIADKPPARQRQER